VEVFTLKIECKYNIGDEVYIIEECYETRRCDHCNHSLSTLQKYVVDPTVYVVCEVNTHTGHKAQHIGYTVSPMDGELNDIIDYDNVNYKDESEMFTSIELAQRRCLELNEKKNAGEA
jgi:hypothetical protein